MVVSIAEFERSVLMMDGDTVEVVAGQAIFRHADGTIYGGEVSPTVANEVTMTFQALKSRGFTDSEARRGAEVAKSHVGDPIETKIVKALAEVVKEEEAPYGAC